MVRKKRKNPLYGCNRKTDSRFKNLLMTNDNSCLDYITDNIKSQGVDEKWILLF